MHVHQAETVWRSRGGEPRACGVQACKCQCGYSGWFRGWCGAGCLGWFLPRLVRCGTVRYGAVRCGTVRSVVSWVGDSVGVGVVCLNA
jgi:hypothetical protein